MRQLIFVPVRFEIRFATVPARFGKRFVAILFKGGTGILVFIKFLIGKYSFAFPQIIPKICFRNNYGSI
jgi:hypothetical protein